MNIDALKDEKKTDDTPFEIEIADRNGETYLDKDQQPVVFQILGEYSKQYRENEKAIAEEAQALRRKGVRGAKAEEEARRLGALTVAGAIAGWRGVETADGKPVPFSLENAGKLLLEADWIAGQVKRATQEHSRFFVKRSPT